MGTDIHLFVEHRVGPGAQYVSLSGGQINLPRDYAVFAALAGVRTEARPHFPPRGFPEDASADAHTRYYSRISEEGLDHDGWWFLERPADARRYVESGLSHTKVWRDLELVSDPDAHHASWLLGGEVLAALERAGLAPDQLAPEYRVVVAALDLLADRDARVVFWFDN